MTQPWWQTATIYQIYPRSFQDTDGDGIGDLKGIIRRIPYLRELGIDAVWISPFYPSPMKDFGYDISDYCGIDPLFGTMADFDRLSTALHDAGLKLILDLVPNHSSDQHPWFIDSRASRTSPKRDWYIWREPAPDGGPPNNWLSEFGGSAWAYDAATEQFYYHAFLALQPDLNWRNVDVRSAMHDVMRFWLRKGVDGFRVDVMWHLMKDAEFRDDPQNPDYRDSDPPHKRLLPLHSGDVDDVHEVVEGLRRVVDEFDDRVLIGELYLPFERLARYYGRDLKGAHLPFNFALLQAPWHAESLARLISDYEKSLPPGGWPNWVLGNHDRPRVASRVGAAQAGNAALLLLTLRGTPTLYYGDELGMPQVDIPSHLIRDPFELNVPGKGVGRDGVRTPMQWSAAPFAGFSTTEPWLPLSPGWRADNVENLAQDDASILSFYRCLLRFRKTSATLQRGRYRTIAAVGDVLLYERELDGERILLALNLTDTAAEVESRAFSASGGAAITMSTFCDRTGERIEGAIALRPNEGLMIQASD
jgi:alpha-glucosidase